MPKKAFDFTKGSKVVLENFVSDFNKDDNGNNLLLGYCSDDRMPVMVNRREEKPFSVRVPGNVWSLKPATIEYHLSHKKGGYVGGAMNLGHDKVCGAVKTLTHCLDKGVNPFPDFKPIVPAVMACKTAYTDFDERPPEEQNKLIAQKNAVFQAKWLVEYLGAIDAQIKESDEEGRLTKEPVKMETSVTAALYKLSEEYLEILDKSRKTFRYLPPEHRGYVLPEINVRQVC